MALPANLLVLPAVALAMLLGFLTGVVGLVSTTLALPLAWASWAVLAYILLVVKVFASIPSATVLVRKLLPHNRPRHLHILHLVYKKKEESGGDSSLARVLDRH